MSLSSASTGRLVGLGVLLVLGTALISGVSTFVNSYAVAGTNSAAFVTVRNLAVAAFIAPIALVVGTRSLVRLLGVDFGWLALIGLIGGAIPFLLFFQGLELATKAGGAATASFVYRTLFLMAAVFGVLFLKERFSTRVVVAAVLLLAGNLLLLSIISPLWTPGMTYVFAATALWAAEYTVSKKLLARLPSTTVGFGRMGFGAVFLVGYLGLTSQYGSVTALTGGQWVWVGISAALLTAFVLTWYAGLKQVDLVVATSVLVLGFPMTWLLGILVRGTPFTADETAGATAILAGTLLVVGWQKWNDLAESLRNLLPRRVAG